MYHVEMYPSPRPFRQIDHERQVIFQSQPKYFSSHHFCRLFNIAGGHTIAPCRLRRPITILLSRLSHKMSSSSNPVPRNHQTQTPLKTICPHRETTGIRRSSIVSRLLSTSFRPVLDFFDWT